LCPVRILGQHHLAASAFELAQPGVRERLDVFKRSMAKPGEQRGEQVATKLMRDARTISLTGSMQVTCVDASTLTASAPAWRLVTPIANS